MNQKQEEAFRAELEQTVRYGTADTITMLVVSAPTAIQVKIGIDFMYFVKTQQRT